MKKATTKFLLLKKIKPLEHIYNIYSKTYFRKAPNFLILIRHFEKTLFSHFPLRKKYVTLTTDVSIKNNKRNRFNKVHKKIALFLSGFFLCRQEALF